MSDATTTADDPPSVLDPLGAVGTFTEDVWLGEAAGVDAASQSLTGRDPGLAAAVYGELHGLTPEQVAALQQTEPAARADAWEQTKGTVRNILAVGGGALVLVLLGVVALEVFEVKAAKAAASAAA